MILWVGSSCLLEDFSILWDNLFFCKIFFVTKCFCFLKLYFDPHGFGLSLNSQQQ